MTAWPCGPPCGRTGPAARLLGAAVGRWEATGIPVPPRSGIQSYSEATKAIREGIGNAAFDAAWAEGRAMSLEQAVAYALSDV